MIILFQNILVLEEIFAGNACLPNYLPKLKRNLGLAFGAYFLHDFSIKMFLFHTLSIDKVSISYLFFFSKYQTKYVVKFLFR